MQSPEQRPLGREVLEDGLDHQIAGAKIAELGRLHEAAGDLVELLAAELAPLDRAFEEGFGLAARALERLRVEVVGDRGKTRARGDDRDPGTHRAAGAGDADRFDLAAFISG